MICTNSRCRKEFAPMRSDQTYCSTRCQRNAALRRWRTKYNKEFNAARRAKMNQLSFDAREKLRKAHRKQAKRLRHGYSDEYRGGICRANNNICLEASRGIKHRHCECGMAMSVESKFCEWCKKGK